MWMKTRETQNRFTLVELLVVIAIIGILAGFLMPAINNALKNGRKTACMNNLRQIGMAVQQYSSELYFSAAPQATATPGKDEATLRADLYLLYKTNLMSDKQIYICPLQSGTKASELQDFGGHEGLSFGLTEAVGKTNASNRIILADEKGAGDFSNNHGGDSTKGEDQNCAFADTHVKRYAQSNPDDDSDTTSIYTGTASATDTVIYGQ